MLSPIIIQDSSVVKFLNSWGFNRFSIFIFPFILLPSDEDLSRMFKKKFKSSPNLITFKQVTLNTHFIRFQQNLELFWLGYMVLFLFEFLINFWKYGKCDLAIKNVRFEQEIYQNNSIDYFKTREVFGWREFKIFPDLEESDEPVSPEITVIESSPLVESPKQGINFEITDMVDDDITPVREDNEGDNEEVNESNEDGNESKNQDEEVNELVDEQSNEHDEENESNEDEESNEDDEETRM